MSRVERANGGEMRDICKILNNKHNLKIKIKSKKCNHIGYKPGHSEMIASVKMFY